MKNGFPKEFASGVRVLDDALSMLKDSETIEDAMRHIVDGLSVLRQEWDSNMWSTFCSDVSLKHPVTQVLFQAPVVRRSVEKPRGYSGDAIVLDYLYEHNSVAEDVATSSAIGQQIHNFNISTGPAESVRWRRSLLADLIDETASRVDKPDIMSVACGHLRETAFSEAIQNQCIGKLVGLDQDGESLSTIETEKNGAPIECFNAGIRELIRGRLQIGTFDFIYSAGLYDYLPDSTAHALTKTLFKHLNPGGRLLIANFVPGKKEYAYMEACLDWYLIQRSKEDFESATADLRDKLQRLYYDDNRYVLYLEFLNY